MSRKNWPKSWSRDFEVLLNFHGCKAIEDGQTVILMNADQVAFAVVPVAIELSALQATLPILRESFDMGVQYGRDTLSAQLRGLLGVKEG